MGAAGNCRASASLAAESDVVAATNRLPNSPGTRLGAFVGKLIGNRTTKAETDSDGTRNVEFVAILLIRDHSC